MPKKNTPQGTGDKIPHDPTSQHTIKEKVRKHIKDINDVITDDDIRNAKIDNGELQQEIEEKEQLLEENTDSSLPDKKKGKAGEDPKSGSSWDVLD